MGKDFSLTNLEVQSEVRKGNPGVLAHWRAQHGSWNKGKAHIISRDILEELYFGKGWSQREIAEHLGVGIWVVTNSMERSGLKARNKTDEMQNRLARGWKSTQLRGERHYNWKGGKYRHGDGYIMAYAPGHPRASSNRVLEHRLIWEQTNGRPLPEGWVVHHINGRRDDNRPENLFASPRASHHYALLLQALKKRIRELEAEVSKLRAERRLL